MALSWVHFQTVGLLALIKHAIHVLNVFNFKDMDLRITPVWSWKLRDLQKNSACHHKQWTISVARINLGFKSYLQTKQQILGLLDQWQWEVIELHQYRTKKLWTYGQVIITQVSESKLAVWSLKVTC